MPRPPRRRTKIIATVGPARGGEGDLLVGPDGRPVSAPVDQATLAQWLIKAGADVLRFNMSFAGYSDVYGENESAYLKYLLAHRDGIAGRVAVLGDLPGPKIRLAEILTGDDDRLAVGDAVLLNFGPDPLPDEAIGASVHVNGRPFALEVGAVDGYASIDEFVAARPGAAMTVGDGRLLLEAAEARDGVVRCHVVKAGRLQLGKGLTIKGADLEVRAFGENDHRALEFLLNEAGSLLAWVAVSFAHCADDILEVRQSIAEWADRTGIDGAGPGVLVKVETRGAWENIDDILDVADGAMVARGDLGEQLPIEDIPSIQKDLIRKCNIRGKPVITATQMLDSMETNPDPTRAECTDVYNAVLDGTDAVMLSGETSAGMYPTQAVVTMDRVTRQAEDRFFRQRRPFEELVSESRVVAATAAQRLKSHATAAFERAQAATDDAEGKAFRARGQLFVEKLARNRKQSITDRIGAAACALAEDESAAAIIAPTASGRTVFMISRFRPQPMIIGAAHDAYTYRKLILAFGVVPLDVGREQRGIAEVLDDAVRAARREGLLPAVGGIEVVATAGSPLFESDTTNLVQILRIEEPEG